MKTARQGLDKIETEILRIIASVPEFILSIDDLTELLKSNRSKVRRGADKLIRIEYVQVVKERNPRILKAIVENPKVSTLLKASVHFSDRNADFFSKLNYTNTQKYRNLLHLYSLHHGHRMPDNVKKDIKADILSLEHDQIGSRLDQIANQWCDIRDNFKDKITPDQAFHNASGHTKQEFASVQARVREKFKLPEYCQIGDEFAKLFKEIESRWKSKAFSWVMADKIVTKIIDYEEVQERVVTRWHSPGMSPKTVFMLWKGMADAVSPEELIQHLNEMLGQVKECEYRKTFRAKTRIEQMDGLSSAVYDLAVAQGNREWIEEVLWSGTNHREEMNKTRERLKQEKIERNPSLKEYIEFQN